MQNQRAISLAQIIDDLGIEEAQCLLKNEFLCFRNPDIEHFLHHNAVRFEQAKATRTFLLMNGNTGQISAYFSLSFKSIEVCVSKSKLKKLTGGLTNSNKISVFLIAQLGKNTLLKDNSLTLSDILKVIISQIKQAQSVIGGKVIILECENNARLISLYEKNGFSLLETTNETDLKTMFIIPEFNQ